MDCEHLTTRFVTNVDVIGDTRRMRLERCMECGDRVVAERAGAGGQTGVTALFSDD